MTIWLLAKLCKGLGAKRPQQSMTRSLARRVPSQRRFMFGLPRLDRRGSGDATSFVPYMSWSIMSMFSCLSPTGYPAPHSFLGY